MRCKVKTNCHVRFDVAKVSSTESNLIKIRLAQHCEKRTRSKANAWSYRPVYYIGCVVNIKFKKPKLMHRFQLRSGFWIIALITFFYLIFNLVEYHLHFLSIINAYNFLFPLFHFRSVQIIIMVHFGAIYKRTQYS